jgi:hypothetical protein
MQQLNLQTGWTGIVFKNEYEFPVYMELGYDGELVNNSGAVKFPLSTTSHWADDSRVIEFAWRTSIRPTRAWQAMRRRASELIEPVVSDDPIEDIIQGAEGFLDRAGYFYPIQQDWGHSDAAKGIALALGFLEEENRMITPDMCFNLMFLDHDCVVVRGSLVLQHGGYSPLTYRQREVVEALYDLRHTPQIISEYEEDMHAILSKEIRALLRRR